MIRWWMVIAVALVAIWSGCGSPVEPDWGPVQEEANIGAVRLTAQATRGVGGRLAISLVAQNTSTDPVMVELLGGPCLIIARVFADAAHTDLKWRSKQPDEECVLLAYAISLEPLATVTTVREWDHRITSRSYVTAEVTRRFDTFHLDAGRVDVP